MHYQNDNKDMNKQKISKYLQKKILTDSDFSRELSVVLGIKQISTELSARRLSVKLTQVVAYDFYKSKGLTDEQIFETEKELTE